MALLAGGPLRVALGALFVLFFPGYVLVSMLFPKKSPFDGLERVALACGMSLAVVPFIGLLLNYTTFGVRLEPIAFSILGFVIGGAFLAFYRRMRLPQRERFEVKFDLLLSVPASIWRSWGRQHRLAFLALSIAVLAGVSTLAVVFERPQAVEGFTEFYVLGPKGKIGDYPREITLGRSSNVTLAVINREQGPVVYRVEMKQATDVAKEIGRVRLEEGESREWDVTITPSRSGLKQEIVFLLYRGDTSEVYKGLRLVVDVKG